MEASEASKYINSIEKYDREIRSLTGISKDAFQKLTKVLGDRKIPLEI